MFPITNSTDLPSLEEMLAHLKKLQAQQKERLFLAQQILVRGRLPGYPSDPLLGDLNVLLMFPSHEPPEWLEFMLSHLVDLQPFQYVPPIPGKPLHVSRFPAGFLTRYNSLRCPHKNNPTKEPTL